MARGLPYQTIVQSGTAQPHQAHVRRRPAGIDPAFSPDGRFITSSDKTGNFDIWVKPVAGGDAVQVTKAAVDETQPTWSADGNTIAFRSEQGGGGYSSYRLLAAWNTRSTQFGTRPRWSPDGSFLLFAAESQHFPYAGLTAVRSNDAGHLKPLSNRANPFIKLLRCRLQSL